MKKTEKQNRKQNLRELLDNTKGLSFVSLEFCKAMRKIAVSGPLRAGGGGIHTDMCVCECGYECVCECGYGCVCAKLSQLCPTLCNPMNCSPPGSSVHGILQTRILGWVAISFSRGSSQPRDRTCVSYVSCIGRQVLYH